VYLKEVSDPLSNGALSLTEGPKKTCFVKGTASAVP